MMSPKHWLFVALFLLVPVNKASTQETKSTEPGVETLLAKLKAMEDEKTWPYEKLNDRADVAVIGRFEKRVAIEHDLSKETEFSGQSTTNLTILVSTIKLNALVKGDIKNKSTNVIHLKREKPIVDLGDWWLYEFRAKQNVPSYPKVIENGEATGFGNATVRTIEPEYLLFLKSRDDGRFEPVSGHRYAGYSVRVLND